MLIILPEGPMKTFMKSFNLKTFFQDTKRLGPSEVKLTMPIFELRNSKSLIRPIQSMGVTTLFDDNANLPYMIKGQRAGVSDMTQDAYISVNEKGTKASAISTVNVITLSASIPEDVIELTINKPFLAFVLDKKQNIPLFMAKVMNI